MLRLLLLTVAVAQVAMAVTLDDTDADTLIWSGHQVVPEIIDEAPKFRLSVDYPKVSVQVGQNLNRSDALVTPNVTFTADPEKFYTLSMVDPDAPSKTNQSFGEVNHWLVVNIPGENGGAIEGGQVMTDYGPPGPPKGTGFHRYIFLVFEQPKNLTFDEEPIRPEDSVFKRVKFSIRKFSKKYSMGSPVFGNFFETQFQEL